MSLSTKQTAVLLVGAICATVRDAGEDGAPGGIIYAALMEYGISLELYEAVMASLVSTGKLRKQGELYFYQDGLPKWKIPNENQA